MSSPHVSLLGSVQIEDLTVWEESLLTHMIQELLAFLMLNRHQTFQREVLAGVFLRNHPQ